METILRYLLLVAALSAGIATLGGLAIELHPITFVAGAIETIANGATTLNR